MKPYYVFYNFGIITLLVTVVGVVLGSISIPSDTEAQTQLAIETIETILQFKQNFDRNPELYQAEDGDAFLNVTDVIAKYGYPFEIHEITTEDGYIVQAHRIPYGLACGPSGDKRVVWLQHGLMGDSSNWVITGNKNRGLAFELADGCYDVWMGNTYSKKHTLLSPNETEFWNFSWHEIGKYDVRANIDHALMVTGAESLYYIGHSMGTTTFFVAMSEYPEYNAKVKLMSALAPVSYNSNMRTLIARILLGFLHDFEKLDYFELLQIDLTRDLAAALCKKNSTTQPLCVLLLFLIGGDNPNQFDTESLPAILGHTPAGCSSKAFLHYAQCVDTGDFKQYDYYVDNPSHYNGSNAPPAYDLSKITAPIAFYYGDNDFLADKVDVLRSVKYFANGTIVRIYRVDDPLFTHLDFIWALDQHSLINKPVMDFMEEFSNPPSTTDHPGNYASNRHLPGFALLSAITLTRFM